MEDTGNPRKRCAKGKYNQYLKEQCPLLSAPSSSKRIWLAATVDSPGNDSTSLGDHQPYRCTPEDDISSTIGHNGITNVQSEKDSEAIDDWKKLRKCHTAGSYNQYLKEINPQLYTPSSNKTTRLCDVQSASDNSDEYQTHGTDEAAPQMEPQVQPQVEPTDDRQDLKVSDKNVQNGDFARDEVDDQPVYPGARLTLGESMMLMMSFVLKYTITGECLKDLLHLISLHCPAENLLPMSILSFKRWFGHIKHPLKIHKYCSSCHLVITEQNVSQGVCPNNACSNNISGESGVSHFIELPVADQLRSFFKKPSFLDDIRHRFVRKKSLEGSIEDIYDGAVYKGLSQEGGVLSNPLNLSLLWNTDGIPCFKSSNMSLWPLFFQINELPFSQRICPENMILGGLWFGKSKPTIMSFTEPFVHSLNQLETEGVQVTSADGSTFVSKVFVIGGTADLPARSLVCNTVQYNGKYGCCKCLQPGETCKVSARGHVHIFPFDGEDPSGPKRTHQGSLEDVTNAVANNNPCRGSKGPSFLMCLAAYNLVAGTCIDYMHGVLLGVTKLMLSLWFLPKHSKEQFSLLPVLDTVDARLKSLKPPNVIKRLPRSIRDHMKHFKASELKSWLLYYSLPILKDLQHREYFQHYVLLVNAMFLLLQESISLDDVEMAHNLLIQFCCLFSALYGERYVTCNVHQLLHLADMVKDMGPLWVYSCFSFENANGNLLKLFNGTQNVDCQIVEGVTLLQNLPNLRDRFIRPDSPALGVYREMQGCPKRTPQKLYGNVFILGGKGKKKLNYQEKCAVTHFLGFVPLHYVTFNRIRMGKLVLQSKMYSRAKLRNSRTVSYTDDCNQEQFGQVICYMQLFLYCQEHGQVSNVCGCDKVQNVALINPHDRCTNPSDSVFARDDLTGVETSFISVLEPCNVNRCQVVLIERITQMCVLVELKPDSKVYVCKMPNCIEMD